MSMNPPALHLVMHAVAIKKHGDAAQIARVSGLPTAAVEAELARAIANGRLAEVGGKVLLTPAGQMILMGEYSRFYADLRRDQGFGATCGRFELINRDLKQLITDWQTLEVGGQRIVNNHTNREHDARIIDRLGALHERFEPVLTSLTATVPRLQVYARGLDHALERAEAGDGVWISEVKIDSYHTLWFELHEELLRLLGRQREE